MQKEITDYLMDRYDILFATAEDRIIPLVLQYRLELKLILLIDPDRIEFMFDLADLIKMKFRRLRVRFLPARCGELGEGWQKVLEKALKPSKKSNSSPGGQHPRFKWKPAQ